MPDIGRFGKAMAQRAKDASQQVVAGVNQAATHHDPEASSTEINQEVGRLTMLLERRRPAPGPVRDRWSIGIGDILTEHPRVPRQLHEMLRTLDRYGGLSITEQSVAFDGDRIEWSSVTEIRTRNVVEYLLSDGVQQQIGSLPLPWFPGRRAVLDALSKALLTLLLTTARQQLDRPQTALRIPAEIHYRGGRQRDRELVPGVLAALALADPAVNQCLVATAQAHGIVVRPAPEDGFTTAEQRAAQLRTRLGALEATLQRWRSGDATPPPPGAPDTGYESTADVVTDHAPARPARYPLPDQGETVARWARDAGGDCVAAVVEAEVARVRRPDGALAAADLSAYRKAKDGPLSVLHTLLALEAISVRVWAEGGFGMMQKGSAGRQVEKLCREEGLHAAVEWALRNATHDRLQLGVLDGMLGGMLRTGTPDEPFLRSELARSLRKWG